MEVRPSSSGHLQMILVDTMNLVKQYGKPVFFNGFFLYTPKTRMSSKCLTFCVDYLSGLCRLSPPSFKLMHQETWQAKLMELPLHYILERLKSPVRNLESNAALFCIQCPDTFYLDLLGHTRPVPKPRTARTQQGRSSEHSEPANQIHQLPVGR